MSKDDPSLPQKDVLEFSRPGSAYIFNDNISHERQEANSVGFSLFDSYIHPRRPTYSSQFGLSDYGFNNKHHSYSGLNFVILIAEC